jgi:predicted Na+-dependent transporter
MFNADLALSVTMTAISTILSVIFLPMNLLIYATYSYDDDVVENLDWTALFIALCIVIGAISLGLFFSAKVNSPNFNLMANKVCRQQMWKAKLNKNTCCGLAQFSVQYADIISMFVA